MTQFLYDPGSKPGAGADELVAEYNGSGALLRRYVHGLGTDDPSTGQEGAGLADRRSLQADHQGSIIGVANSAGASIAINAYDEWGVPNAGNQGRWRPAPDPDPGYTGQAWLPELGMYHYKARIYSPTLGRFLQTDPVGYEDQVNLYAYVGNDPVNVIDPSGLCGTRIEGRESAGCSGATLLDNIAANQDFKAATSLALDFVPVVGALKGITEAVEDPTTVNVAAAVIGIVPGAGKLADKGLQIAAKGVERARPALRTPERIVVDSRGNAIPLNKGEYVTRSPDGRWVQVRSASGKPTGVRMDGPHKPNTHPDPRAQRPHAHVPGVYNPDGTPWLPIK